MITARTNEMCLNVQPSAIGSPTVEAIIRAQRAAGRPELIHFAGASHRDGFAWEVTLAWVAEPLADLATLKSRAFKAHYRIELTPEQCMF